MQKRKECKERKIGKSVFIKNNNNNGTTGKNTLNFLHAHNNQISNKNRKIIKEFNEKHVLLVRNLEICIIYR